jgi:hypothetical protein
MTGLLYYALISNICWLVGCIRVRRACEEHKAKDIYYDSSNQYSGVLLVGMLWPAALILLAVTIIFVYTATLFTKLNSIKVF